MTPAELAAQHNLDAGAVECLVAFLRDRIDAGCPDFPSLPSEVQAEIIRQGVEAWHEHSERILVDLASGSSEWAKEARRLIAEDVWRTVRGGPGPAPTCPHGLGFNCRRCYPCA